jgi:DMSO/TMAO reductase YedYZ molybdopterin-dependent catalytic subunit
MKTLTFETDHRSALRRLDRRMFLRGGLSAGALTLLTGCNLEDDDAFDRALAAMSRWNDQVQMALFGAKRLAPTYVEADITDPFPFNAYYPEAEVRHVDGDVWRLEVSGLVADTRSWRLDELRALPAVSQITRHVCIEGWSAIGQWGGVPLGDFLARIGADTRARYVAFRCADDYRGSLDMATALHPQTLMALDFRGTPLPPRYGYPMKIRVPTKLGFKNPKHVTSIEVTNAYPGGFWEDYGYNWFSGL